MGAERLQWGIRQACEPYPARPKEPELDQMKAAEKGDTVKVHYTGRFSSGETFDSSEGREPLEFTIGDEQVIPGFESAVVDMHTGESRTISIPPSEAYGDRRSEVIASVERSRFPDDIELQVGQQLRVGQSDGEELIVTITELSDTHVTIDGNHPLAGQELVFDITLMEIV